MGNPTHQRTIDPSRLTFAIVTHDRPKNLEVCLTSWCESLPDCRTIILINHGSSELCLHRLPGKIRVIETGRPPEHPGNLAQSWNLAMLWAYRDPEVEWLLCSQDDVEAKLGWADRIDTEVLRDLYIAPGGDQVFLLNRCILRTVGWFDERFTSIGFQEWDWQMRALRAVGKERLSIEDAHGWEMNAIGLAEYWVRQVPDHGPKSEEYLALNRLWIEQKWGKEIAQLKECLQSGDIPDPLVGEVEWYPWFRR